MCWLFLLMLAVLAVVGVITYLLISVAGLSVIPRYLVVPSLVMCFGVAFSLVGWERLKGTPRRVGIWLAVLTLLLMVARAPAYFDQLRGLNTSTDTISVSYSRVIDILGKPKVRAAIERCATGTSAARRCARAISVLPRATSRATGPRTQPPSPPS